MADEVLKRFLVELVYKMDQNTWNQFNQTINNTTVHINQFNQTINVLSNRMSVFMGGGGGGAGGGGGGGGAGSSNWGLIMQLPGMSGIAGSVGLIRTGGVMGALVGGLQILGNVLGFVAREGIKTSQMMVGLHWAAVRVGSSIGSLYGAGVLSQMMGGVPYQESAMTMGTQLRMYPSLARTIRARFPDLARQYLPGDDPSKWDINKLQIGMAERISRTSSSFAAGVSQAGVFGISPDVYAIGSTPEGQKSEQQKLKQIEEINKRTGWDPTAAAAAADKLNTALIELQKTFEIEFMNMITEFIGYLTDHKTDIEDAFKAIIGGVEKAIELGKMIGAQKEPEFLKPDPKKSIWDRILDFGKYMLFQDNPDAKKDTEGRVDEKKNTDATQKQTDATDKNTEALNKIVEAGTTYTALESGGISGLPAWGSKGGTVAAGRGGRGGGGGDGDGGGGMITTEEWKKASSHAGALTALYKAEAIKAAGGDNDEARRIFMTMQGIRAGESGHGSKYDYNPNDPSGGAWGPFQMVGGGRMGTQFEKAHPGMSIRDPSTIPAQTAYVAKWIHEHPHANIHSTWFGYRGQMKGDPRWGESGYRPTGEPIGTAGSSTAHHTDNSDHSISHPVTINVTGFDDPKAAGKMIASSLDDTQQRMVRNFRTKIA